MLKSSWENLTLLSKKILKKIRTTHSLRRSFKNKINCIKKREEQLRRNRSKQIERQRYEFSKVQSHLQAQNKEMAEKNKYLVQKDQERNNVVKQKKQAIEQELIQRREIRRLKRENQLYNLNRELAIKNDYKNQLIEKLKEKAQKADRANERIKTAATYSVLNMTAI